MKDLSLNILDIAMNSVKAGAHKISIIIDENEKTLSIIISDDGCGMTEDFLKNAVSPFATTRTTRKVGMGLPLFKLEAEMTGGSFDIKSRHVSKYPDNHGTDVKAVFDKTSVDFTPLGDIVSTIVTLIQGSPEINWIFFHSTEKGTVSLDTDDMTAELGDVPLNYPDVLEWVKEYLTECYENIGYKFDYAL